MKAESMILSFSTLLQNGRNIICVSSSPRSEKVKKILWERFVQKEYHLCNTHEWMRKLQTKIRQRSSMWKQQEVQLLHWMNFSWKTFKIVVSMKNNQNGKVACLQQLSIGISLAQFRWVFRCVDGELRAKKVREKQSEVQGFIPRSSSTSCDAFWRVCFAIKAERMILPFSQLLENG